MDIYDDYPGDKPFPFNKLDPSWNNVRSASFTSHLQLTRMRSRLSPPLSPDLAPIDIFPRYGAFKLIPRYSIFNFQHAPTMMPG